ncbi:hypothetical protein RhiirB3_430741 [Rhizophagus irregularis]|nr:hypothetical protein RhiirB3_430741 [Rhizophagus irregularis]
MACANDISKFPTNPIISEDEIKDARLSKVCAHNIEELHLHSGKQGRGGKKQSGTAKRSNDPNDDKLTKEEIESLDYSGDKGDSDNHHQ